MFLKSCLKKNKEKPMMVIIIFLAIAALTCISIPKTAKASPITFGDGTGDNNINLDNQGASTSQGQGTGCEQQTIDTSGDNSMTVPVSQLQSPEYVTWQNQQATLYYKYCVSDPAAEREAKDAVKAMKKSGIDWINTAFNGNPVYVKNTDAFFSDIADSVAGNTIQNISQSNSPFQSQLTSALSTGYAGQDSQGNAQDPLTPTITADDYNNFMNGTSDPNNFWNDWLNVSTIPQNNPFGASMIASYETNNNIESTQAKYRQQLDWGRGFLSSEDCSGSGDNSQQNPVYDQNSQPVYGVEVNNKGCVTATPGATIQEELDTILGSKMNGLNVAQNIDAVQPLLPDKMMEQTLGESPQGLAAAGNESGSSGLDGGNGDLYGNINGTTAGIAGSSNTGGSTYVSTGGSINGLGGLLSGITNKITGAINGGINSGINAINGGINSGINGATNGITGSLNGGSGSSGNSSSNYSGSTGSYSTPTNTTTASNPPVAIPTIICAEFPSTVSINKPVTWEAVAVGGNPPFTYRWQGDDNLSGTSTTTIKSYSATGLKTATIYVTDVNNINYSSICSSVVSVTP